VGTEATPLRRNRDFVLLLVGEAASQIGSRAAAVAYPLLALSLTGSPSGAGLLVFAERLPWFLFTLPAGALSDRANRRVLMLTSDAVACSAMVSVAWALFLGRLSLAHLYVAAFIEGTAFIVAHVAQAGVMKQVVPAHQVPDAVARRAARTMGAALVGPPLGGLLFGLRRGLPFLVNAFSYLVSFVTLLFIRSDFQEASSNEQRRRFTGDILEGLKWLWSQPFLRASLLLVGAANFFSSGLTFVLVILVQQESDSPARVGLMLAVLAAGGLVGSMAAPRLRNLMDARLIVVGYNWVAALITIPLAALVPNAIALGGVFALLSFFGPTWDAVVDGYRIAIVPDRLQGRISSVDALLAFGAIPLGPLAGGYLIERLGARPSVLAFGGVMLFVSLVGTFSPALRKGPSRVAPDQQANPAG
jgi:predicted MFS family arabinose efflux permease